MCITPALVKAHEGCDHGYTTIEATLTAVCRVSGPCLSSAYKYTIEFDDADLVPDAAFTAANILGVFCKGCLTSWVEDQVACITSSASPLFLNCLEDSDPLVETTLSSFAVPAGLISAIGQRFDINVGGYFGFSTGPGVNITVTITLLMNSTPIGQLEHSFAVEDATVGYDWNIRNATSACCTIAEGVSLAFTANSVGTISENTGGGDTGLEVYNQSVAATDLDGIVFSLAAAATVNTGDPGTVTGTFHMTNFTIDLIGVPTTVVPDNSCGD